MNSPGGTARCPQEELHEFPRGNLQSFPEKKVPGEEALRLFLSRVSAPERRTTGLEKWQPGKVAFSFNLNYFPYSSAPS